MRKAGLLTRDRAVTLGFVGFSLALAFWQSPGWSTTDTKIDLHVDPARFLQSVASVWTPTTDLGNVHSSQYSGYVWPMAPFFAALHLLGLGAWVVERLWLALLFALAAWGMVRLLDVLVERPRGIVHIVAAAFYMANPFVVVSVARSSINLLGYAALPWLLLVTYHGIRASRGWRGWRSWWWAGAFSLILTSTGGGVNAALIGWVLLGPLVLACYEPATGAVCWRDSAGFLARAAVLGILTSLWWIVPVLVHVRYGIDFLKFTEQPSTIWATNSATESIRLMGFWNSYGGVGFDVIRPLFSDAGTLLFNPLVVGASLLIPAIAIAGTIGARRDSYTPLLLCLVLVGVLVMVAGFPDGTPLRQAMVWVYQRVFVLRFMRTTYKAAPLVALGVAGLLGLVAAQLGARLRSLERAPIRRAVSGAAGLTVAAMIALAAWPLVQGKAIDTQFQYRRIPSAWIRAGRGLDRSLPANSRAIVLPGQIFAFYTWGGTGDAILPRLTNRPVAVRYETPYSDLHAAEVLTGVDDLVQQRRLVPGQLPALLRLMGVGAVVTGADDDVSRSGAIDPAAAAGALGQQLGSAPTHSYGPPRSRPPAAGDVGAPVSLPQVRRYDIASPRGIVHVDPVGPSTIVDGGVGGLAGIAAFGQLPDRNPIFYAGDLSSAQLRQQAARGADIVVSDSNRRAVFVPEYTQQNHGPTLSASESLPSESANLDPFAARGSSAQTVSALQGAHSLTSPTLGGQLQFPEHGAIAAFDGNLSTSWIADRFLALSDAWVQVGFKAPRNVPYVDVYPLSDAYGVVTEIDVNGIRHAVGSGWTRVRVNLHRVSAIRITIDRVRRNKVAVGSHGGFREIRIPGVSLRQPLRPPTLAESALAGQNLAHDTLTYQFERATGDDPFKRNRYGASSVLNYPFDRGDAEQTIDRLVDPPVTRSYTAQAWIYPSVVASDSALDRLAGFKGSVTFDSSARFQNQPAYRASSAFDGRPSPGWVGIWAPPSAPPPWISWRTRRPLRVSRLVLSPSPLGGARGPTVVGLSWEGGQTPPLPVARDGSVVLPHPATARSFRLTVLQASSVVATPIRAQQAWAVGIGSISVPGLAAQRVPRQGALRAGCGSVSIRVGATRVALRPEGTIQQLDAGIPLRARSCSTTVTMPAGVREIRAEPGVFSVDLLQLRSPAPVPATVPTGGGSVTRPGSIGNSSVSASRLHLVGPSWVVLGESFNAGWRATCDGRSLGAPRVIDAYANGWLASSACREVAFSFGPQSAARASYWITAVSCLLVILFMLFWGVRGGIAGLPQSVTIGRPEPLARRLSLPRAAAISLLAATAIGAVFALRMGAVSFPVLTLILWRGIGSPTLVKVAALLLGIAVPIVYLIVSPQNLGGYNFSYSVDLLPAHWIGVVAIVLLGVAAFREISAARGDGGPPSAGGGLHEPEQDSAGRVEQEVIRS